MTVAADEDRCGQRERRGNGGQQDERPHNTIHIRHLPAIPSPTIRPTPTMDRPRSRLPFESATHRERL